MLGLAPPLGPEGAPGPPVPPTRPVWVFWLAQLTRIAREPSHSPFIVWIACSASGFSLFRQLGAHHRGGSTHLNDKNPYPLDLPVFISHMTLASDMVPNAPNALLSTSSLTSGLRSPTNT